MSKDCFPITLVRKLFFIYSDNRVQRGVRASRGIIRARLQRNSGKIYFFLHMSVLCFIFNRKLLLL